MNPIVVAAAVIVHDHKILITRRSSGNLVGYWEFPGGKLEPGETLEECLAREIREELDIEITVNEFFCESTYAYPDRKIKLSAFLSTLNTGLPRLSVHDKMAWVKPHQLIEYQFAHADIPIVEKIRRDLHDL